MIKKRSQDPLTKFSAFTPGASAYFERERTLDSAPERVIDSATCACIVEHASVFSSPEPKALGELIGWESSRGLCVRPCVHQFTLQT